MKVLHILNTSMFSGAENVVCQIIEMCKNDNIDFVYCSKDGQIRSALEDRDIKFVPIENMSKSEIKRVIKEEKPDLIHAHDMRASFFASISCGKIPLISHIHVNNENTRSISVKALSYLYAGLKAKKIFWVSQSSFEGYKFKRLLKNKSEVLYNIISIDSLKRKRDLDINQYNYDVIFLGRICYQKNVHRLIEVLGKTINLNPKIKAAIIGTGPMEDEIKSLIKDKQLDKNIEFFGFNSNPYKILSDAKVMLMTSRYEGTPMCALEAMSLGVPIVSTRTDGMVELVESNVTGYLEEDDNVLAERICRIIDDNDLREALSRNTIKKITQLMDIQKYHSSIINAYNLHN